MKLIARILTTAICVSAAQAALSKSYPYRSTNVIVSNSIEGSTGRAMRLLAPQLIESLGQPIAVENPPCTGSACSTGEVTKSATVGYTQLFETSSSLGINWVRTTRWPMTQ